MFLMFSSRIFALFGAVHAVTTAGFTHNVQFSGRLQQRSAKTSRPATHAAAGAGGGGWVALCAAALGGAGAAWVNFLLGVGEQL